MANYEGSKCIVCNKVFDESDDIVVCPECGTPYHRDCYKQVGECINIELHNEGVSWGRKKLEEEKVLKEAEKAENIICPRCGYSNDAGQNFCSRCGLPLNSGEDSQHFNEGGFQNGYPNFGPMGQGGSNQNGSFQNGQPFNPFSGFVTVDDNTDIDGVSAKDIADYVGSNKVYFLSQFMKFAKLKIKKSFNFCAFVFPEFYYFYRKMIGHGFFYLTFRIFVTVFMEGIILKFGMSSEATTADIVENLSASPVWSVVFMGLSFLTLMLYILSGLFSNFWYFKKTKHDIKAIDQEVQSVDQRREIIAKKGGTSFGIAIAAIAAYYLIIRVVVMLIA